MADKDTVKAVRDDLDGLAERVARLEELTGVGSPARAEEDQEAADRAVLSRHPTTYDEAVAYEAALARQEARGADGGTEGPTEADEAASGGAGA